MAKQVLVTGASGFVGSSLDRGARGGGLLGLGDDPTSRHLRRRRQADLRRRLRTRQSPFGTRVTPTLPITWCTRWPGRTSSREMLRRLGHSERRRQTQVLSG